MYVCLCVCRLILSSHIDVARIELRHFNVFTKLSMSFISAQTRKGKTSNDLYYDEIFSIYFLDAFYFYTRSCYISIIEHVFGEVSSN